MIKKINTTMLGAFVTGAIVLLVIAIILFGGEGLFTRRERVIMYFSGSVDGLNVGAPVNVRGVEVGTVTAINIEFNTTTGELRVPVIAEIDAESIDQVRKLQVDDPLKSIVEKLGLRAQLKIQSILTSQLFIQLDYHPETEIHYYGDGNLIEIPTIPMPFAQIDEALQDISIEQMLIDIASSVSAINRLVNSPDMVDGIATIKQAFVNMDQLSRNINEKVIPLTDETLTSVQNSLAELKLTLTEVRLLVAKDSPQIQKLNTALDEISSAGRKISQLDESPQMRKLEIALEETSNAARSISTIEDSPAIYNLNLALEEITDAARALQQLADTIEKQPEVLLKGKNLRE